MEAAHAFIAACAAFASPAATTASIRAASETLVELRSRLESVTLAQQLLSHDGLSPHAYLQAALLLRDACIRNWALLTPPQREAVRSWCLSLSLSKAHTDTPLSSQMMIVHAVLCKRAWIADAASPALQALHASMLHSVSTLLSSPDRPPLLLGCTLCSAMLAEFDARAGSGATSLAVPAEMHSHAADAFQVHVLPSIAGSVVQRLVTLVAARMGVDDAVYFSLISVVNDALMWEFSPSPSAGGANGHVNGKASGGGRAPTHVNGRANIPTHILPGRAWSSILADEQHTLLRTLIMVHDGVRQRGEEGDCKLAALALHTITLLCALSGDVWKDTAIRTAAARTCLTAFNAMFARVHAVMTSSSPAACARHTLLTEGDNICVALDVLLRHARVVHIVSGGGGEELALVLTNVHNHASTCLAHLRTLSAAVGRTVDVDTYLEVSEVLWASTEKALEAVCVCVRESEAIADAITRGCGATDTDVATHSPRVDARAFEGMRALCAHLRGCVVALVEATVTTRVRAPVLEEEEQHEDTSVASDHMSTVAAIARFAPDACLPFLTSMFTQAQAALQTQAGLNAATPSHTANEMMWWCVSYVAATLCDDAVGELITSVPASLNTLSRATAKAARAAGRSDILQLDPVCVAISHTLTLTHAIAAGVDAVSPALRTVCLRACSRISRVYMLPDLLSHSTGTAPALSNTLSLAYGNDPLSAALERASTECGCVFPVLPTGLRPFRIVAGVHGGRAVMAWLCEAALSALCGAACADEDVCDAAITLLRACVRNQAAARAVVCTHVWSRFVTAASVALASPSTAIAAPVPAVHAFNAFPHPDETRCVATLVHMLSALPARHVADVVEVLLTPVRGIASEEDDYDTADAASAAPSATVARWQAYMTCIYAPLHSRMRALAASMQYVEHAYTPAFEREVSVLTLSHSGVMRGTSLGRIPEAWHTFMTVFALSACADVVARYKSGSPATLAALTYMLKFTECEVYSLETVAASDMYASLTRTFQAYDGVVATSRDDDCLQDETAALLGILSHIIEKEDLILSLDTQETTDDGDARIRACAVTVLTGVRVCAPLITHAHARDAYIRVCAGLCLFHSAVVASADGSLFTTLWHAVLTGMRVCTDADVVCECLQGLHALLEHHILCARVGFSQGQGLRAHMLADPSLCDTLLTCILTTVLSTVPAPPRVCAAAAAVVADIIVCGGDAYARTCARVCSDQPGEAARERLTREFEQLNSVLATARDMSKQVRSKFADAFEAFVNAVRGFTTIR